MQLPTWIRPMGWGIVLGAVGTMTIGFSWMGWTLSHTTTRLVAEAGESAVVTALTPFCVSNYLKQPDAAQKLALLREDTSEYTQRDLVEKAGFSTIPGNTEPSAGVASACVKTLRSMNVAGPAKPAVGAAAASR